MIPIDKIKINDVVFIHKMPVESSIIGIIRKINYPEIVIETILNKEIVVNANDNIPLSVIEKDKQSEIFSDKEIKKIKEFNKKKTIDLFEDF